MMLQGFSHTCRLFYVIMIQVDNRKEAKKSFLLEAGKIMVHLLSCDCCPYNMD